MWQGTSKEVLDSAIVQDGRNNGHVQLRRSGNGLVYAGKLGSNGFSKIDTLDLDSLLLAKPVDKGDGGIVRYYQQTHELAELIGRDFQLARELLSHRLDAAVIGLAYHYLGWTSLTDPNAREVVVHTKKIGALLEVPSPNGFSENGKSEELSLDFLGLRQRGKGRFTPDRNNPLGYYMIWCYFRQTEGLRYLMRDFQLAREFFAGRFSGDVTGIFFDHQGWSKSGLEVMVHFEQTEEKLLPRFCGSD